ncbi:hypothetical protein CHUAL_008841 [Chamberlinius hualienensis]
MKLMIDPLMLLLCWSVVKANIIPEEQLEKNVMPSVYPKIQAEAYSYVTSGAYIYNDCGSTTVGNLRNGGMLRFDNVDVGVDAAAHLRIRYSNKAVGASTTVTLYNVHPSTTGATILATVVATRTNDWCDFAEALNTAAIKPALVGVQPSNCKSSERQSKKDERLMLFPTVQAESFSYSTGASITMTVKRLQIRYSNQAAGTQTLIDLYTVHPDLGGESIGTVQAKRTNDWCDFAEIRNNEQLTPNISGIQNLYLVFSNEDDPTSVGCDIDWFSFKTTTDPSC